MRLYRTLLRLYPAGFRAEYGTDMLAIFAARRQRSRGLGVAWLWIGEVLDIVRNAARVHADILRQDLRYTSRALWSAKGFALTAIAVTALGIGATTAAFSVTDLLLIRPLGFADAARLVKIWERQPEYARMEPSPANYRDWKHLAASFESMGAYTTRAANVVATRDPVRLTGAAMTADVFTILGARAAIGRLFAAEDDRPGAPATLVLSHAAYVDDFAADPSVLGRSVRVDDEPYTIIGVMQPGFTFPSRDTAMWMPLRLGPEDFEDRDNNYLQVLAKLQRGVTLDRARAEMTAITEQLERTYPKENEQTRATVAALGDEVPRQTRLLVIALFGASFCLLLIACTNLAGLLVARAIGRRGELAVRAALGAGRERLVRQLLTESLTIALAGGAAGVGVAAAAVPLLTRLVPISLPIGDASAVDARVLAFALGLSLVTALAFGVAPAWRLCRAPDMNDLRAGARASAAKRGQRARAALVVAQVAASVALLVAAALLLRALWRVQQVDPGFRTDNVLAVQTPLAWPRYAPTARRADFYTRALDGVRQLPGVSGAAFISFVPMTMTGGIWPIEPQGAIASDGNTGRTASLRYVTPGFFDTLDIPIVRGRDVSESDTGTSPFVALVSESFARRYWPNADPVGRRFKVAMFDRTIVGVVRDVRVRGLERPSEPQVYLPYRQIPDGWMIFYAPRELVVRASIDPLPLAGSIRAIIRKIDPELPVARVRTVRDIVDQQTAPRVTQLRVLQGFAALSLLLAGIGIHGLLSYAVSQRRGEIGLRMALGADSRVIAGMIARQGLALAAAGAAIGVALAYAAGRQMEALLAGIPAADPVAFVAAAALALVMTLGGTLLPALRAGRVDAASVMRSE